MLPFCDRLAIYRRNTLESPIKATSVSRAGGRRRRRVIFQVTSNRRRTSLNQRLSSSGTAPGRCRGLRSDIKGAGDTTHQFNKLSKDVLRRRPRIPY
ncbi:hypothetical protein EVAR_42604_1 [Eumeta japonica]|uniref:Uncharacterized protein n=1 Tax=Eumeta variegata TaxID=151549 RepID=A0A4C1XQ10_EUMVA|nr:hypothetical protein EVAR_42604_1 [Eumeta japonica]